MPYETVIGLEVHAQVLTQSKIFCGCSTRFGAPPNSQTCPVCLGLPGTLPVLNKKVVDACIKLGLATRCQIAPFARFARKNYFYPDLPKGYQISMYEYPPATGGQIEIVCNGESKTVGIVRIHMEEDAGKNLHDGAPDGSYVDLNRAGIPLLEIVSAPDMSNAQEAVAYLKALREILLYTGVSDADMEKGNFRCDANVSIRPRGTTALGARAEIKNLNSFRFIQKALEYEIKRQTAILEEGGRVVQETRLFSVQRGVTSSMRSKEEAHDYRYFPEPDLMPLHIDEAWIASIRETLPELPDAKRARFIATYQIPSYDAGVLTGTPALARFYEEAVAAFARPKEIGNWIMGDFLGMLNSEGKEIDQAAIAPGQLAALVAMIDSGQISGKIAKTIFEQMYKTGADPAAIVEREGLSQVSDRSELSEVVDAVIAAAPKEVLAYRSGKTKLMGFFVGEVMKQTGGRAHPTQVNELLRDRLKERPLIV